LTALRVQCDAAPPPLSSSSSIVDDDVAVGGVLKQPVAILFPISSFSLNLLLNRFFSSPEQMIET
jgi:hypothetical protein